MAVESYLRPLKIRVAEYTCVLLGFDLTVGLCQIRYSFWRFPDEESFLTRVLKMENVESCTEAVKLYFNVHGGLPSNLSEAVRSYTGADYIYYTCLLEEALQIIYARSVQVVKLCLNSTSSSY
ncbi:hypothetical protein [Deinococcus sp.]|uniref:hypothetical protein n=1 Tax=Deinococcus sp. TaxID=47478 RepID=UPI003CC5577D